MKYKFEMDRESKETEVTIRSHTLNDEVKNLIDYLEQLNKKASKWISYRSEEGATVIKIVEIFYIEVDGEYLKIRTDSKVYRVKDRLYKILEKMNDPDFVQVSKSAVINLNYLDNLEDSFSGTMIAILINESKVPVSRRYLKYLMKHLGI